MPRPQRSVVFLCIAVVALAAFLPGISALDYAVPQPSFVLLPDLSGVLLALPDTSADEQPVPFDRCVPSRAPPPTFS